LTLGSVPAGELARSMQVGKERGPKGLGWNCVLFLAVWKKKCRGVKGQTVLAQCDLAGRKRVARRKIDLARRSEARKGKGAKKGKRKVSSNRVEGNVNPIMTPKPGRKNG